MSKYFLCFCCLSLSFAAIVADDDSDSGASLPKPDFSCIENIVVIEANTDRFGDLVSRGASLLLDKKSGFTPQKDKPKMVGFDDLINRVTNVTVKIRSNLKKRPGLARNLFGEGPQPSKKCKVLGLDREDDSNEISFFVDPIFQTTSVGVKLEHPVWESLVPEILSVLEKQVPEIKNEADAGKFLLIAIRELTLHLQELSAVLILEEFSDEKDCRIHSTLALGLFNKIFASSSVFYGSVSLLGGNLVNEHWKTQGYGHLWNIVNVAVGNYIKPFWVDPTWALVKYLHREDDNLSANILELDSDNSLIYLTIVDPFCANAIIFSMHRLGLREEQNIFLNHGEERDIALAKYIHANGLWMNRYTEFKINESVPVTD